MSPYSIQTDEHLCIACKACEVHCKVYNKVPVGLKLGILLQVGPHLDNEPSKKHKGQKVRMRTLYMPCNHCDEAPCLKACPTGAMRRRTDGIVYIESGACTGCKGCLLACPWQVPQFDPKQGKMRKCDLCRHRIDAGLKPACVTGCTMGALHFAVS